MLLVMVPGSERMNDYTALHKIQEKIIKRLSYSEDKSFSDIKGEVESNKFAFHLNQLKKKGLIKQTDDGYSLTPEGREILPYFDLDEIHHPVIVVDLLVFSGDKVYLSPKRNDPLDPFEGDFRALSSRIGKTDRVEEKAGEIFREEFGEEPTEIQRSAVFDSQLLFDDGSKQHYLIFYFKAEMEDVNGENWFFVDELDELDLLPGLEEVIKRLRDEDSFLMGKWDLKEANGSFEVEELEF